MALMANDFASEGTLNPLHCTIKRKWDSKQRFFLFSLPDIAMALFLGLGEVVLSFEPWLYVHIQKRTELDRLN